MLEIPCSKRLSNLKLKILFLPKSHQTPLLNLNTTVPRSLANRLYMTWLIKLCTIMKKEKRIENSNSFPKRNNQILRSFQRNDIFVFRKLTPLIYHNREYIIHPIKFREFHSLLYLILKQRHYVKMYHTVL